MPIPNSMPIPDGAAGAAAGVGYGLRQMLARRGVMGGVLSEAAAAQTVVEVRLAALYCCFLITMLVPLMTVEKSTCIDVACMQRPCIHLQAQDGRKVSWCSCRTTHLAPGS